MVVCVSRANFAAEKVGAHGGLTETPSQHTNHQGPGREVSSYERAER